MKVQGVNQKEKSTVEVVVEVPASVFEAALEQSYRKNRGGLAVPGFRKGKAPRRIIERMYGDSVFYEDAINATAPDAFQHAVETEGLKAVGTPSLNDVDVSETKDLTLTFITGVYPVVTLGAYKGLSGEKNIEKVAKEDVDRELESLQKRNARIQAVERAAKDGDTAVIDFEGFLDGVPFAGGKGEGHELILGSRSFVPGFEEQVVGMKPGDEREVKITFPMDYAEELAGKDVVFAVKCQEVKERILPELDDEFAKDVSEFDTLAAYRADIEARLTREREENADKQFKDAVLKQATENMEADVPEAMVEQALDGMMRDFYYSVRAQGMDPGQYLQMMGMDVEGFREGSRGTALQRIRTGLLLDAIAEAEAIAVEMAEIEAEYDRLSEQYKQEKEAIQKALSAEDLTSDLKRKKASDLIYDSAKAEKVEKAEKKESAKKTAKPKDEATEEVAAESEKKPAAKRAPAKKATGTKKAAAKTETEEKE